MKRWFEKAVVAVVLFAPLAALADLAYEGPPNDYIGFLFRNGYYRGDGVSDFLSRFGLPLGLAIAGGIVLAVVKVFVSSASKRGKVILSCILTVVLVAATSLLVLRISRESQQMVQVPLFPGWPDKAYRDTPKHRAEYDAHCLQTYRTWSYSGGKWYAFEAEVPKPRKEAPVEVKEAFRHLRERASKEIRRDYDRDHGRIIDGGGE